MNATQDGQISKKLTQQCEIGILFDFVHIYTISMWWFVKAHYKYRNTWRRWNMTEYFFLNFFTRRPTTRTGDFVCQIISGTQTRCVIGEYSSPWCLFSPLSGRTFTTNAWSRCLFDRDKQNVDVSLVSGKRSVNSENKLQINWFRVTCGCRFPSSLYVSQLFFCTFAFCKWIQFLLWTVGLW